MKKISLALTALGLSVGAFAALPAATDPTLVSVPQLPGGFVIGASGFYLQPANSNGDLDYAAVNNSNSSGNNFSSKLYNVDPGYDWGWGVNVGYIFPNTGNNINLSYFQLNTSDTNSVFNNNLNGNISGINNTINFVPFSDVFGFAAFPSSVLDSASAKVQYDLNQVDLTAGQYINVGCRLSLHPYAGLRWAQLERKINSNYGNNATGTIVQGGLAQPTATLTLAQNMALAEKSDFEGIGPIVGIDASYYVGMGFGIVGHFDSALLIGNIDAETNDSWQVTATSRNSVGTVNTFSGSGAASFSASNTRRIVPVLDGKLGADYTYVFNNTANSDLTLEAGWMVSNYFNAVDRLQTSTTLGFIPGSESVPQQFTQNVSLIGRTTSDFAVQGPYVSLVAHL